MLGNLKQIYEKDLANWKGLLKAQEIAFKQRISELERQLQIQIHKEQDLMQVLKEKNINLNSLLDTVETKNKEIIKLQDIITNITGDTFHSNIIEHPIQPSLPIKNLQVLDGNEEVIPVVDGIVILNTLIKSTDTVSVDLDKKQLIVKPRKVIPLV